MPKMPGWLRRLRGISVFGFGVSWAPQSQQKSEPGIDVEFRPLARDETENDYCHLRTNPSFNRRPSWFFRLGIINKGRKAVRAADVLVEEIATLEKNGEFKELHFSPFFLHWSNEHTDDSSSLHPETPVFVDVVCSVQGENTVFILHKRKHAGAGIPSTLPPGQYRFKIKVVDPEITPVPREVCVDFDGQWDNVKVNLLQAET